MTRHFLVIHIYSYTLANVDHGRKNWYLLFKKKNKTVQNYSPNCKSQHKSALNMFCDCTRRVRLKCNTQKKHILVTRIT